MSNSEERTNVRAELFGEYPDVVTPEELRVMLRGSDGNKMGIKKIYGLLRNNEISSFRIGRDYRILKSSVIDYVCGRAQQC